MIDEAGAILRDALAGGTAGPFQLEAAISAVHCEALVADGAFALSRVEGAAAGLELLESGVAGNEPYLPLVRGVLLAELGREDEALAELARAEAAARNVHEAAQIRTRAEARHLGRVFAGSGVQLGCPHAS